MVVVRLDTLTKRVLEIVISLTQIKCPNFYDSRWSLYQQNTLTLYTGVQLVASGVHDENSE